jgi:hypothetical protein
MLTAQSNMKTNFASCQIGNGIPSIRGRVQSYYVSRKGVRMLVVERSAGQRIRINGTIDVVVLEAGNGNVQIGIDILPNAGA